MSNPADELLVDKPLVGELPVEVNPATVDASIGWLRGIVQVRGTLQNGFAPEGDRLLVELHPLQIKPADWEGDSLWVDLTSLQATNLIIRSDVWEFPAGEGRDYALRTFLFAFCNWLRTGCDRVEMTGNSAEHATDTVELAFWISVPIPQAFAYLQQMRAARGEVSVRPLAYPERYQWQWQYRPEQRELAQFAHNASHLSHLFIGSLIWSYFRWLDHRLYHVVQFSIERKHEKTLVHSFKLRSRE